MSRRRKLLAIAVCLTLVLGSWTWISRDREVRYENRPVWAWLDDVHVSNSVHTSENARRVVHQLGEQALPTLRKAIRFRPTRWRTAFLQWSNKLPTWIQQSSAVRALDYDQDLARQFTALEIVRELGSQAAPLVPDLEKLASDRVEVGGYPNSYVALLTLKELGPKATPALANLLAVFNKSPRFVSAYREIVEFNLSDPASARLSDPYDRDYRLEVIDSIREISAGAEVAIPALLESLNSTNTRVVLASGGLLAEIKQQPNIVVPALLNLLDDPDQSVRQCAAMGLGSFGNDALFAVPRLQAMLGQNSGAQNEVLHAIRRIRFATSGLAGEPDY